MGFDNELLIHVGLNFGSHFRRFLITVGDGDIRPHMRQYIILDPPQSIGIDNAQIGLSGRIAETGRLFEPISGLSTAVASQMTVGV